MEFDVIGLGNPIIDVIINVDDTFLTELNLEKGSMNLVDVERQNQILRKSHNLIRKTALGGSCANTMAMIAQLGGKSAYGGKVGNDDFAQDYQNQLVDIGVTSFVAHEDGPTGTSIILVSSDAERTMNTHLGMCQSYSKDDVNLDAIGQSKYLYVTGYLWDTPTQKEAVVVALDHAKAVGVKIAMSLSDSFCVERHKDDFQTLMSDYVDVLFCNEAEGAIMSGVVKPEDQLSLLSESVEHIIITLGKQGSLICCKNEVVRIGSFDVKAIDTTGAGDSFAAGYLYGMTHEYPLTDSGNLASYCAATIVSHIGPRYDGNFKKQVEEYLK